MRGCMSTGLPGVWRPSVHSPCPHNELAALLQRSLGPIPVRVFERVSPATRAAFGRLRNLARLYADSSWSYLETAQSYNGSLRRRYVEAERSLRVEGPIGRRDWYLRPFLKAEKFNAVAKVAKPRLIYPRSPRYNLALASRLKPFEHWLWGRLSAWVFRTGGVGRIVAKGLNPVARANLIRKKMANLDDCVVCEIDGKAFEAHVGRDQLLEEQSVYRAAFPGDQGLVRLLAAQLTLEGTLPCGAKFSREGGRASGDFNTGMGNTIVMCCVVVGAMRSFGVPYDLLVDGDNALIFVPGQHSERVVKGIARRVFEESGHEVTLESPTRVLEEVRFGRSAPVWSGGCWRMVRDWTSVLSGALCSHRWLKEPTFAREWVRGVAGCELSLARGVPVLQAWALELSRQWGGPEGVRLHPHADLLYQGAWLASRDDRLEVTLEARLSFERAFGVTPDAQVKMERGFRGQLGFDLRNWTAVCPPTFDQDGLPPGFVEPYADAVRE